MSNDGEDRYVQKKKLTLLHGINDLNWSCDAITRKILVVGKDFQS